MGKFQNAIIHTYIKEKVHTYFDIFEVPERVSVCFAQRYVHVKFSVKFLKDLSCAPIRNSWNDVKF